MVREVHGYWVDPAGQVYDVGAYGHSDFARHCLHDEGLPWRAIERIADPEDILLDRGWVRVSISGVWFWGRELRQGQIDTLWELAGDLNGEDDRMAREIMGKIQDHEQVRA